MKAARITRVDVEGFTWDVKGVTHGRAHHYDPDSALTFPGIALRVYADNDAVGEFATFAYSTDAAALAGAAPWYVGRNPLERELAYQVNRRVSPTAVGAFDYEVVWVHPNVPDFAPPIFKNMFVTRLDCIDKDGFVSVPDGPGLGAEYDWDFIARHSTGRKVVQAS